MTENLNVILIIEILGKPADYIKGELSKIVENLGKEKDVKMIYNKIAEPKKLENDVFTTFAEIEIVTSLEKLMMIIFAYMPSHIEIIKPEDLKIKNSDLNSFLNEIIRKLHQYDELAKAMLIEKEVAKQEKVADYVPVPARKKKVKKKVR